MTTTSAAPSFMCTSRSATISLHHRYLSGTPFRGTSCFRCCRRGMVITQASTGIACHTPVPKKGGLHQICCRHSPPSECTPKCRESGVLDADPSTKTLETMRKFSEQYARRYLVSITHGAVHRCVRADGYPKCAVRRTGTYFCVDKSVTAVVIKVRCMQTASGQHCFLTNPVPRMLYHHSLQGLAEHKDELGAPLCPCRHYDDKKLEAEQGFWNCPCVPMRERKVGRHAGHVTLPRLQGLPVSISLMHQSSSLLRRSATACCS